MFWVCRNTFSESYFALTYRPSFGRMTSPRTDPFSSVATFSDITSTLPSQGYRRNFSSAFSVDDDLLLDTLPDKAVNDLGPEHHFPIQGNLHRSHTWETLEGVVLRGHLAQAVGPAEQVFLRGILRLVNQFGVAEHTFHTREGCIPCDYEMVDDFAGIFEEPKPWDDVDRLAADQSIETLPNRLRAQPSRRGELVNRRSRIVNQGIEHSPVEARQFAAPPRAGDPMPARVAVEESPQRCDRAVDVVRPDFHRQPAVHLPCDPRDVRRDERLNGLVSAPNQVEGDDMVLSP